MLEDRLQRLVPVHCMKQVLTVTQVLLDAPRAVKHFLCRGQRPMLNAKSLVFIAKKFPKIGDGITHSSSQAGLVRSPSGASLATWHLRPFSASERLGLQSAGLPW